MRGTNRQTGRSLSGVDHLKQSITDILTTPIGSRVMRRDYGSNLFKLTDAPLNQSTLVELYASTAGALKKWEPRINVKSVKALTIKDGKVEIEVTGTYYKENISLVVTV